MKLRPILITLVLAGIFTALQFGCTTQIASKHISKDTRVCVFLQADDVLVSESVVGTEIAVDGVSKRIERYLTRRLH